MINSQDKLSTVLEENSVFIRVDLKSNTHISFIFSLILLRISHVYTKLFIILLFFILLLIAFAFHVSRFNMNFYMTIKKFKFHSRKAIFRYIMVVKFLIQVYIYYIIFTFAEFQRIICVPTKKSKHGCIVVL